MEENQTQKPTYTSNTKRIAKNTLMLYFRQILIMLVSLYTVRVVLNTLGAEDYGIYNVVAGVVTMFGFLSGAMATASQRFFSFAMGRGDSEGLKKTFSVTVTIYVLLILVILLLAETLGLWFVLKKLVIPLERKSAAMWVYQFSVASFVFTMITTPYMAAIIAHENMSVYAYVSIVEAVLKLALVFLLKILPYDKLIVYGFLMLCVALINTSLYRFYCKKNYEECRFHLVWDKGMFGEIFGFTGWSVFGSFAVMMKTQAITVLINQFFSPIIVAARTISTQVTNTLNVFSANFNTSLYAPIVKEYAAGNKKEMFNLIFDGCKMTFFLMWIFSLPLCLRMEYVLTLWLKELPEYVVTFTILSVIESLVYAASYPITTASRASGNIKAYELILGALNIVLFVACYVWVKFFEGEAVVVYYVGITVNIIMFVVRLVLVKFLVQLSLRQYMIKVILPIVLMIVVSSVPTMIINKFLPQNFISLVVVVIVSLILSTFMMYAVGLSKEMKEKLYIKLKTKFIKNN